MRPLPLTAVGAPAPYVRGVAVIRGSPTPVVDLGALAGGAGTVAGRRFVTLRGPRPLALWVDEVLGVRTLPVDVDALPSLLASAEAEVIAGLGRSEERLLLLLQSSFAVPPEVYAALGPSVPPEGSS